MPVHVCDSKTVQSNKKMTRAFKSVHFVKILFRPRCEFNLLKTIFLLAIVLSEQSVCQALLAVIQNLDYKSGPSILHTVSSLGLSLTQLTLSYFVSQIQFVTFFNLPTLFPNPTSIQFQSLIKYEQHLSHVGFFLTTRGAL